MNDECNKLRKSLFSTSVGPITFTVNGMLTPLFQCAKVPGTSFQFRKKYVYSEFSKTNFFWYFWLEVADTDRIFSTQNKINLRLDLI